MSNKVVHCFQKVDMRNQHDGLTRIAQKSKVRLDQLGAGEHVIFINANLNKVKMYSASGVLSYKRSDGGCLNLGMIEQIPLCFEGGKVDWDKAEKLALEKQLARGRR